MSSPIIWDEPQPTNNDPYAGTPSVLRSLKTTLATALSQQFYWPGSGGGSAASAGQFKPGAARAFYGVQSSFSVPSPVTTGLLYETSDSSRLFAEHSGGTMFMGSARLMEHQTFPGQNVRWVMSAFTMDNDTNTSFGTVYDSVPNVTASLQTTLATFLIPVISSLTAGGVTVNAVNSAAGVAIAGTSAIHVVSLGTITF